MTRDEALERLQEIAEGRWSTWNQFAHDLERGLERSAMCDAMEAVKMSALVQALTIDGVLGGIEDRLSEIREPGVFDIPSVEAIEFARKCIEHEVAYYDEMRAKAIAAKPDDPTAGDKWKFAAFLARRNLLGQGGCVVACFDERWLSEDFRKMMIDVRSEITAQ